MLKKITIYTLAFTMVLLMTSANLLAQTPIRFARGRNSATVSGTLSPNSTKTYLLRARSGQSLNATVSSTNGKVDFTDGDLHDTQFSRTVDSNGNTQIRIDNHGNRSTKFSLTVSIQ